MGWSNQPVVAPVVVIVASGPGQGLFVYSGTPANGNLVASIAAAAGTDTHGNPYQAGITSYSSSSIFANLTAGLLEFVDTAVDPSGAASIGLATRITTADSLQMNSPVILPTDLVAQLFCTRGPQAQGRGSVIVGNAALISQNGTPTWPTLITTDTWNNFSLQNGCTAGTDVNGTTYTPAYMLTPTGDLKIRGVVVAPAAGLAAGTTWGAVPVQYRPGGNCPVALISNGSRGTISHVYVRPNGNMQFDAALGAGVAMWIDSTLNVWDT